MNSITRRIQDELDEQTLALDIARNQVGMKLPIKDLLAKLHVSEEQFRQLAASPLFKKQVKSFVKELEENGVSFRLKAQIQAEEMLKKNWAIVHDPDTPATVAVKAIENTVRWAGLEAKSNATVDVAQGPGFSITINFPTEQQQAEAKAEAKRRADALNADAEEIEDGEIVDEEDTDTSDEGTDTPRTFTLENPMTFDSIFYDDSDAYEEEEEDDYTVGHCP